MYHYMTGTIYHPLQTSQRVKWLLGQTQFIITFKQVNEYNGR